MDRKLSSYLEKTARYLKPLAPDERADIILEIKSEMLELEKQEGFSPEQIIARLGEPRELAKSYLGEAISKGSKFSVKKISAMIGFYSVVGLSGMIILPVTGIMAGAFLLTGVAAPILGLVKLLAAAAGFEVPFIMFQMGSFVATPLQAFVLSIVTGVLFLGLGYGLWKVTLAYIKLVSTGAKKVKA